jgi:hypothetical protein
VNRILLLIALALVGCAEQPGKSSDAKIAATVAARPSTTAAPAPPADSLHTSVSGRNVADITRDVQGWHDMQHANCKFARVLGAEIVSQDEKSITEHWTIEACKQQAFTYKVYIIRSSQALRDMVSNVDGSAVEPTKP